MDGIIKILVVEDDNEINQLLCEIITKSGYLPQPAYSGTEALLYLAGEQAWSMVLLDLMLPGLKGDEILQQLGPDRQFPVIMISAKGEQHTKASILRMGADDYITKPFDIEEVSARIDIHLRRYRRVAAVTINEDVAITLSPRISAELRMSTKYEVTSRIVGGQEHSPITN
ncbi:hypothetical protein HMSSN036_35510 [Paenibacillus macerans]|uniref:response regulator transcription factor n=1 Tax=Paenibacillus sp. FSL R5-0527 TaxID=2975321 RepID=UPI00208C99BF|nr:hypothetical protein HMSSN036_35510 [Paenibacillus macerans]